MTQSVRFQGSKTPRIISTIAPFVIWLIRHEVGSDMVNVFIIPFKFFIETYMKQVCIPVRCVPAAGWPYLEGGLPSRGVCLEDGLPSEEGGVHGYCGGLPAPWHCGKADPRWTEWHMRVKTLPMRAVKVAHFASRISAILTKKRDIVHQLSALKLSGKFLQEWSQWIFPK